MASQSIALRTCHIGSRLQRGTTYPSPRLPRTHYGTTLTSLPLFPKLSTTTTKDVNKIRPVIGFVTTGDYSLIRGEGHAIGFCTGDILKHPLLHAMVLIRNPTSVHYHAAVIAYLTQY